MFGDRKIKGEDGYDQ